MRFTFVILLFCWLGADAQMVIKAHANYRPYAQPAANLLLDDYPNAAAAYSLRKLDKDYTGACMRIRRVDNSQETDIGFVNNYLDTTAIKNFTGSETSAVIVTWYDQSGNGRNASQSVAANQPAIMINNFVFATIDGLNTSEKAIVFNQANFRLISDFTTISQPISAFTYGRKDNVTTAVAGVYYDSYNNTASALFYTGTNESPNNRWGLSLGAGLFGTTAGNTNPNLFSTLHNGASSSIHINGQSYVSGNAGTNGLNGLAIGNVRGNPSPVAGGYELNGRIAELIIYGSNQSTNRTAIENNINDYYNIYWNGDFTGLLDTYPNSAAAYSLRNLSSTYTGPLIRVRKDTTGQPEMDIYGDYYGNLDTVGLKNFLQTRSGFVTTWYSQGDSTSVNFTQPTAANQPRIALNGVIYRLNGKPVMLFENVTGGIDFLTVSSSTQKFAFLHQSGLSSVIFVGATGGTSDDRVIIDNHGTSSGNIGYSMYQTPTAKMASAVARGVGGTFVSNNVTANNFIKVDTLGIYYNELDNANGTAVNRNKLYYNNGNAITNNTFTNAASSSNASFNIRIGVLSNNATLFPLSGYVTEIIFYKGDKTSSRTGIRDNINTHYGIY